MPTKFTNAKLEIRRDVKRPYYFVRVPVNSPNGKRTPRRRYLLGFVDEISKKEAMKRRADVLSSANSGRMVVHAQIRFGELVAHFREARLPQFGTGTAARYRSQIERHILPAFGTKKLIEIDKPMIEAWLASKESLAWWTREGLRGAMSSIFAAAKDWKLWTGDNPASGVRLGRKKEKREKRLLTAEQLQAILAAVSDDTRLMILAALVVGLRISEICGLQWGDIDFQAGTLTVRRRWYRGDIDEPKTEASKRVRQIGPLAVEFLHKFGNGVAHNGAVPDHVSGTRSARQHQFIFLSVDGRTPIDERDVLRYELRPILKRLGVYYPGFGWHAFRRQNVSWRQTVGGASPFEAMKAAGHTRVDMTMLYTITDAERERGQVEAIMDKLTGVAGGMKQ